MFLEKEDAEGEFNPVVKKEDEEEVRLSYAEVGGHKRTFIQQDVNFYIGDLSDQQPKNR